MPGPGGGGHGGGGRGGGGFGGGHGGGFHGGHHGGYHRHHFWGPRPFFGWGFGGCLGVFLAPVMLLILAASILFSVVGGAFVSISEGGVTDYDIEEIQSYADGEYYKLFGGTTAYEESIMIVFLTNEDTDEYYYQVWLGNDLHSKIRTLFSDGSNTLDRAFSTNIDNFYAYSLGTDFADAIGEMATATEALGVPLDYSHPDVESKVVSYVDYCTFSEDTVNNALEDFTARTGIPIAIVVDDMNEVFGVNYTQMIISIIIVVALVALAIFLIYKSIKAYKNRDNNGGGYGDSGYNNNGNYNNDGYNNNYNGNNNSSW